MEISAEISNDGDHRITLTTVVNAYRLRHRDRNTSFIVGSRRTVEHRWPLDESGGWYDFTIKSGASRVGSRAGWNRP